VIIEKHEDIKQHLKEHFNMLLSDPL
jgi:hypothetical protein